jgi:hypothetical protein
MTDADLLFLRAFEEGTLPLEEWHHRTHLKVAYLYLRSSSFDEALIRARQNIQRYNAATQTPETLDRGYHETITVAWMRLVAFTLNEYGPAAGADEFLEAQEQLLNRKALRFFYSREHLVSWKAKFEFVEPDLTPLPSREARVTTRVAATANP